MARYSGYDNVNKRSVQCTIDGAQYVEMRDVINCYGLGSFSVHIVHSNAGEFNINSSAFDTTNLKNTIAGFGQSGFLGFNSNTASELVNNIDALNIHIVNFPSIALLATLSSIILGKGLMYLMAYIYISNKQRRKNNE